MKHVRWGRCRQCRRPTAAVVRDDDGALWFQHHEYDPVWTRNKLDLAKLARGRAPGKLSPAVHRWRVPWAGQDRAWCTKCGHSAVLWFDTQPS